MVVAGSLLITSIIAGIFLLGLRDTVSLKSSTSPHLVLQIRANPKGWFIFAMVLQIPIFGIVLAISCCNEKVEKNKSECNISCDAQVGRRYPLNIILIGVVAGLYGVLIGVISVAYTIESVFIAAGITCVTVFIVTAFAFWTNIDFTKCLGFIAVLGWFFLPNVLFTLNFGRNSSLRLWRRLCHCRLEWFGKE